MSLAAAMGDGCARGPCDQLRVRHRPLPDGHRARCRRRRPSRAGRVAARVRGDHRRVGLRAAPSGDRPPGVAARRADAHPRDDRHRRAARRRAGRALPADREQVPGMLCSVLLLEGDRLRHGAAPSLAPTTRAIDGVADRARGRLVRHRRVHRRPRGRPRHRDRSAAGRSSATSRCTTASAPAGRFPSSRPAAAASAPSRCTTASAAGPRRTIGI